MTLSRRPDRTALMASACLVAALGVLTPNRAAAAGEAPLAAALAPCRVHGVPTELQCGSVRRALDPARPQGPQIEVHYLVAPARARNKNPDPVLMLAGGPGQSAVSLASAILPALASLNNRRDLVFIDQRGTGRSAPLQCEDDARLPLAQALDAEDAIRRLQACRDVLQKLPYGDLRFFTTTLAMQDFDAVRERLGADQWNLIGGSYGTRAALEYQRAFPARVRRLVIDGVAPPDMSLPASFSADTQAALDALLAGCEAQPACHQRYPALRSEWSSLLASLPRSAELSHPVSGQRERVTLSREAVLRSVRAPLYAPALASALPAAIHDAAQGRFDGLVGLSGTSGADRRTRLATGMHFSVICAEDMPRVSSATDPAGADYGRIDAQMYSRVCGFWPRGEVPAAYYSIPAAPAPALLLSGGADPATPPRHAERVARALGPKARHVVVEQAGHGVMGIRCMRDVIARFVQARSDEEAQKVETGCAARLPRALAYLPPQFGMGTP